MLSIIYFGRIVIMNETKLNASRIVSKAIDRYINYLQVFLFLLTGLFYELKTILVQV